MVLLIDQGNSRLKWLIVDAYGLARAGGAGDAESLAQFLTYAGSAVLQDQIEEVHIVSVAGRERKEEVQRLIGEVLGIRAAFVATAASAGGIRNGYHDPSMLGVDRWLAMLGARTHGCGPMIVADAGTALTVDAIASDGWHLGGYIVPGVRSQCASLGIHTAGVRLDESDHSGAGWGRTTQEAVSNGIRLGMAALIEKSRIELEALVADTCPVILTGGDAYLIRQFLAGSVIVDKHLVFRGLWSTRSQDRIELRVGEDLE